MVDSIQTGPLSVKEMVELTNSADGLRLPDEDAARMLATAERASSSWHAWRTVLDEVQSAVGEQRWKAACGTNLDRATHFISTLAQQPVLQTIALNLGCDNTLEAITDAIEDLRSGKRATPTATGLEVLHIAERAQAGAISDADARTLRNAADRIASAEGLEQTMRGLRQQIQSLRNLESDTPDPVTRFLADVRAEIESARAKFPGSRLTTIALGEELGELCKAVLDESAARVRSEAVQVACMAARVVLDGDSSVDEHRVRHGFDAIGTGVEGVRHG